MAETLSIPHLRDSNTCSVIFVKNHCRLTKLAINRNFVVGSVKMPTHFNENTRGKRSGGIIPRNSANSAKDARYREFLVIFSEKSQNSPQSTILRIAAHFLSPLGPSLPYLGHVCPRTHSPLRKTRLGRGGIGNLATHLAPTVISPHERYSAGVTRLSTSYSEDTPTHLHSYVNKRRSRVGAPPTPFSSSMKMQTPNAWSPKPRFTRRLAAASFLMSAWCLRKV